MEPHPFSVLGGIEKKADVRDVPLGAVTSPTYTFAAELHDFTAWEADVEYQGQQPACGAHAGSKLNGLRLSGTRFSPRFTWADIKTFDGWALEDGTDLRSILKSLTKAGTSNFAIVKNDVGLSLEQYAHPSITLSTRTSAAQYAASGYGFITDRTFKGLKQYINDHGPVILLIRVSERFWTAANGQTSWAEKDILPLAVPNAQFPLISGHFVVAHSYDENNIYFINSFGPTWGRMGHGYFQADYMPYVLDGAALIRLMFTKDLSLGMTDPQVKELQQVLNKNPQTQLSVSGPGSPGNETQYFGPITQAAVIKFQKLHKINPSSGYVGPLTRAVLNTI